MMLPNQTTKLILPGLLAATVTAGTTPRLTARGIRTNGTYISVYNQGSDVEPFPKLMSDPDLYLEVPLQGYDISRPYPGDPIAGWTISSSVKKNIAEPEYLRDELTELTPVFMGLQLRLNPPSSLVSSALDDANGRFQPDPSWRVCITSYTFTSNVDIVNKLSESDDGSCAPALSAQCIAELEEQSGMTEDAGCTTPKMPEACEVDEWVAITNTVAMGYSNWAADMGEENAKDVDWVKGSEFLTFASDPSEIDDEDAVDLVIGQTHMAVVRWNFEAGEVEADLQNAGLKGKAVCLAGVKRGLVNDPEGLGMRNAWSLSAVLGAVAGVGFALL